MNGFQRKTLQRALEPHQINVTPFEKNFAINLLENYKDEVLTEDQNKIVNQISSKLITKNKPYEKKIKEDWS